MKKIFICTDGTWSKTLQLDSKELAYTNVAKLARTIKTTKSQIVYYDRGVGTNNFIDKYTGGAFGNGLFENVKQAYKFIVENYQPNDKIFIFGFSRGAYTARSLTGLIVKAGILRKKYISDIDAIFKIYRKKNKYNNVIEEYSHNFCHKKKTIHFLGVWDTVGALGIPLTYLNWLTRWKYKFHDVTLSPHIKNAFHAVSLDEKRIQFKPTLWKTRNKSKNQIIEQRWFPGVHSNIGGGIKETGLSDITFDWMLKKIKEYDNSVEFDEKFIKKNVKPNYLEELKDSCTGIFILSKLFPYCRKPIQQENANEIIDDSVVKKMTSCNYKPCSL